jgi:hypothetical protein
MEHFILSSVLFIATLGVFALKAREVKLQPVRIKKNNRH